MSFLMVMACSLGAVAVVHSATFLIGYRIGRYNVVDAAWGLGFIAVAAVCAAIGAGDRQRRVLLFVLIAIWGVRLSWHMLVKSAGKGEDPRYHDLLSGDFSVPHVLRKIFVMQAGATWLVSMPIQRSAVEGPTPSRCVLWWPSASGYGFLECFSKRWVIFSCAVSSRIQPIRARSWSRGCGPGLGIRTILAMPACGGGCGWSLSPVGNRWRRCRTRC